MSLLKGQKTESPAVGAGQTCESSCGMCGTDGTQEEVQDWAPDPCMG